MLSEEQIRMIIEGHLAETVQTGQIHGGQVEFDIIKIDPTRAMKWKGQPAWEIDFIFSTNVTITEGMTSRSREYRYRNTLVIDDSGKILHKTKPKLEKDIHGPEFNLDF